MIKVGDKLEAISDLGDEYILTVTRISPKSVWLTYFGCMRIASVEKMLNGGFACTDGTIWNAEIIKPNVFSSGEIL